MKILNSTKEKVKEKQIFCVVSNSNASSERQYLYKNTIFLLLVVCYAVSYTTWVRKPCVRAVRKWKRETQPHIHEALIQWNSLTIIIAT